VAEAAPLLPDYIPGARLNESGVATR
jgi:hypothetical protein